MSNFEIMNSAEEQKLSTKELLDYYKELRDFLNGEPYLDFSDNGIRFREKLNILIKKILKIIIKYDIQIDGLDLIPNEPVIYASSHQDFNDIINNPEITGVNKPYFLVMCKKITVQNMT